MFGFQKKYEKKIVFFFIKNTLNRSGGKIDNFSDLVIFLKSAKNDVIYGVIGRYN